MMGKDKNHAADARFRTLQYLGVAGILPQVIVVMLFLSGSEWAWIALAGGFAYAALILSFLGGVWWGQAMANPDAPGWVPVVAVIPSLIGLALFLPWTLGWAWPEPSLLWIAIPIMLSPFVDAKIGASDARWLRLRWQLSLGLGGLTLILGIAGLSVRP